MTSMLTPQPHNDPRRQHPSTSRNLLNLDCSADLKSYRRDLGPGVQAKCFEKTSETIRAQLDEHRAFLLQHRQSGSTSGHPSPVPRLEVPPSHSVPNNNTIPPQLTTPSNNYHTASHPRPLQILSQPYASLQTSPVPGDIRTYPIGLRQALERSRGNESRYGAEGLLHEVVVTVSGEMPPTTDVVGVYERLQDANMKAAELFIFGGYYASADEEGTYRIGHIGDLRIEVYTDGSTGGWTEIYVRRASARRAQGPRIR